jgi:hypothetical protein
MTSRTPLRTAAVALLLAACTRAPSRLPTPTEAEVRAQTASLLDRYDLDVASFMVDEGHLGYYLRPKPGWPLDGYVAQLPDAAETARALLARYPGLVDVDVCVDGPWLPHPSGTPFVPAARVELKRSDEAAWPAAFDDPADVLVAALDVKSVGYFLDPKVLAESPAYSAAARELSRRRKAS